MSLTRNRLATARQNSLSARAMLLLVLVVWSRLWAGVPETVTHDNPDAGHGHHEQMDHGAALDHDPVHTVQHGDGHLPDASTHSNDEHHHHLHVCSGGGAAIICTEFGIDLVASAVHNATATEHRSVRLPEQLLRPPAA